MSKEKITKCKATLRDFSMQMHEKTDTYYVLLHILIERKGHTELVTKRYTLSTPAAKKHLFHELSNLGYLVDNLISAQDSLDACMGLEVRLKIKTSSDGRKNYYILGRLDGTKPMVW